MKVGEQIMLIRRDQNISQKKLSEMTKISIPTICKIESNGSTSTAILEILCQALNKELVINVVEKT